MHMLREKKAGQEHFLSEKMRRNSGQPIECKSDSDMHVACSMHMAILETERVSHNPIEVLQADSCTCAGKKKQAKNTFFQRR